MAKPGLHLTVSCVHCSKEFRQSRSDQEYCSKECYRAVLNAANREKREPPTDRSCEVCGGMFNPTRSNKKHCSDKCTYAKRLKVIRSNSKTGLGRSWGLGKEKVKRETCLTCKTKFYLAPTIKRRGVNRGKFCSKECKKISTREIKKLKDATEKDRREKVRVENMEAKKSRLNNCLNCNQKSIKKFCNKKCYMEYRGRNKGSNDVYKTCKNCNKEMKVRAGTVNAGQGIFCSLSCARVFLIKDGRFKTHNSKGGKREDLNNTYFRSRWEANYARYLNFLIKRGELNKWEFEPNTFYFNGIKRGVVSYTPDFKVFYPDGKIKYIEVKGYMDDRSKTRMKRMGKYYPEIEIEIFDAKRYRALSKAMKSVIPNWEIDMAKKI